MKLKRHPYPCTIVPTRYGGTYEGGSWAAFALDSSNIPDDPFADDLTCAEWWGSYESRGVGIGNSPDAALLSLMQIEKPLQGTWNSDRRRWIIERKEWPEYLLK